MAGQQRSSITASTDTAYAGATWKSLLTRCYRELHRPSGCPRPCCERRTQPQNWSASAMTTPSWGASEMTEEQRLELSRRQAWDALSKKCTDADMASLLELA